MSQTSQSTGRGGRQRAVVDGGDPQMLPGQHPGPAAGCGTEVDGAHARLEQAFAFVCFEQHRQRFVELGGGAAGRAGKAAQARNAAWHRQAAGQGVVAEQRGIGGGEDDVQAASCRRVQQAGLAQRLVHWCRQRLAQRRQFAAGVAVGGFQQQFAPRWRWFIGHMRLQRGEQRRDAVAGIQLAGAGEQRHRLPSEDRSVDRRCMQRRVIAADRLRDKLRHGTAAACAHVAVAATSGQEIGQLLAAFAFEAGAA